MKRRRTTKSSRPRNIASTRRTAKYLEGVDAIDYKDHELLRRFMTERGKIMPRRTTGATAKQQRQITRAIRRARIMGLLP